MPIFLSGEENFLHKNCSTYKGPSGQTDDTALTCLKKQAKTIRKHKHLILNYFRAKKEFSSGIVEGLNTKVKLTLKKSYGFKQYKTTKIALYHRLGRLPEPPLTHRFY